MRSAVLDAVGDVSVIEATDEVTATALATACRPDVIVLDATDQAHARNVISAVRDDFRTALTPIVSIVEAVPPPDGFGAADDYVVCPFDGDELGGRVRLTLQRASLRRGINPLTDLPGNSAVDEAVVRRLERGDPFACLHIDLDDFKAFNDTHGFARGDAAIREVGRCIVRALEIAPPDNCFVGHVGGDDFVVLVPTAMAHDVARGIVDCFEGSVDGSSISIGVVEHAEKYADAAGLGAAAADAKNTAKRQAGSAWAVYRA